MSQLSVFSGPDLIEEPLIYSFKDYASQKKSHVISFVEERARLRKKNESCPCCNRATVEPVELRDAQYGRNGARIAGTGTIVGFSCNACGNEWSAS
ncbi:hypothetical protein OAH05_00265 [bacterium]|jgi:hypothetical protein|nr:hypothetical protein [Planctomicrobium sp.]MDB4439322.1 hypothetical protein [Planctomicrobium sp.]MDB4802338.1 hypothetical protein [bacterium]